MPYIRISADAKCRGLLASSKCEVKGSMSISFNCLCGGVIKTAFIDGLEVDTRCPACGEIYHNKINLWTETKLGIAIHKYKW